MLFNSQIFLFGFLPVTLIVYLLLRREKEFAAGWLAFASLFFYGYWNFSYVWLLLFSIVANYSFGSLIAKNGKKGILVAGLAFNLALLGYYKYANFFVSNLDHFAGLDLSIIRA